MATVFELPVLLCTIIAVCVYILHSKRNNKKRKEFFKNIPMPPGVPFLGNLLLAWSPQAILTAITKYTREFEDENFKFEIGSETTLVANNYNFIEFVMSSNKIISKSPEYRYFHSWLGTGLLTSTGKKWHQHRKMLTPAFHFKILEESTDAFERAGKVLVQKLRAENQKKNLDIYPLISLCTLDVICESAMGIQVNAQKQENSEYVFNVKRMCKIVVERIFSFTALLPFLYPLTPNYFRERNAVDYLHRYTTRVIDNRRKLMKTENGTEKSDENANGFGIKSKKAFLDTLLSISLDGQPLDPVNIREEVDTFMFEGHDTTSSGISFTIYCLANHLDVQERVYKEQVEIFGPDLKNAQVTYQSLQHMKYLELVIKEALRLYPSVPYIARVTSCDVEFEGQIIPEGVTIGIIPYGIHRNPKYYTDPDKFDPSRFENMDGLRPFSYIPFSAGPRNCIGQKFAMLELKSIVSKVVRNFELFPAVPKHELQLSAEIILKSVNGIKISLRERV